MRSLIFLVIFLWSSSVSAAEPTSASIIYNVDRNGLRSVTLSVSGGPVSRSTLAIVPLPLHAAKATWDQEEVVGVVNHPGFALALVRLTPQRSLVQFEVPVDVATVLADGVSLRQSAYADALVVPPISQQALTQAQEIAEATAGITFSHFAETKVRLESGFVVISEGAETTLLASQLLPLSRSSSGNYQLTFRRPRSVAEEAIQSSIGSLLLALFGLLLAYAAPGLLPQGHAASILIAGTVVVAVVLIGMRWFFVVRSRQALIPAIVDTSVALLYFVGLGIVWLLRRRRSRVNLAAPPPSPPTAAGAK